jgi:hypothetical protein
MHGETDMAKLSDAELATKVRAANRQRSERRREKLTLAGRAALTVWLPVPLRQRFVAAAVAKNQTINEMATALLSVALANGQSVSESRSASEPTPAAPDPLPLLDPASTKREHPRPVSVESALDLSRNAMLVQIGAMVETGMTGAAIARELGKHGFKASNGAELRGANVLREYRQWCEKK